MVDALGSGPSGHQPVEVRVLSSAPFRDEFLNLQYSKGYASKQPETNLPIEQTFNSKVIEKTNNLLHLLVTRNIICQDFYIPESV